MKLSALPQWRIKQGASTAIVRAADYSAAIEQAGRIGFRKPDSISLIEDGEEARQRAIAAYATLSRSSAPTAGN